MQYLYYRFLVALNLEYIYFKGFVKLLLSMKVIIKCFSHDFISKYFISEYFTMAIIREIHN